jgi:hypothetical protein
LGNWTLPEGISLTEIAGWGEDTLSGIKYKKGYTTKCKEKYFGCSLVPVLEYDPVITYDGDGTVVVPSALWMSSSTDVSRYWVSLSDYGNSNWGLTMDRKHADILEVQELRILIENIIKQNQEELPKYISTSSSTKDDTKKKLVFILHSPLYLNLYDEAGNHTGVSTTTDEVEENIPGSTYLTFGEVQYISVPASSTVYLALQGYSSGSFTLGIEETQGDTIIASSTFAGIPSSTSTIATLSIADGDISETSALTVDMNGDGNTDMILSPKLNDIVYPIFIDSDNNNDKDVSITKIGGGWLPNDYGRSTTTLLSLSDNENNKTIISKYLTLSTSSVIKDLENIKNNLNEIAKPKRENSNLSQDNQNIDVNEVVTTTTNKTNNILKKDIVTATLLLVVSILFILLSVFKKKI